MIRHRIRLCRVNALAASFLQDFTISGRLLVRAFILLAALSLSACRPVQRLSAAPPAPTQAHVVSQPPSVTRIPLSTPQQTTTVSPQPTRLPATPTNPAALQVCSPLDGIKVGDLAGHIVNPFHPPPPGSDDPHQGVDLADLIPGSGVARAGRGVQAVLAGRVSSVIHDRFPYGNAILVETSLQGLPAAWLEALQAPTPAPTLTARSALTCPTPQAPAAWDLAQRSLYLLYAHMLQAPSLQPGETVSCGEQLGAIGSSGNALNPHLHLEARVGPAGADFASMAHYTTSASPVEMRAYCDWRVSGLFQLIDPMRFFVAAP
jgi:murein DD-endopeptidase MepM/ murein hydrolase activator NlpD